MLTYVCTHMHTFANFYTCMHTYTYTYSYMYTHMHIRISICTCTQL